MIVSFTEGDPCIIVDDDEPLIKRFKPDNYNNFHLRKIPGDAHCIANCFAVHFDESLDRVLDRLDNEFRENISFYRDFSHFSEDEIKFYVFKYLTEKSYNNDVTDMFYVLSLVYTRQKSLYDIQRKTLLTQLLERSLKKIQYTLTRNRIITI